MADVEVGDRIRHKQTGRLLGTVTGLRTNTVRFTGPHHPGRVGWPTRDRGRERGSRVSNAFEWPPHARRVEPSKITLNGQPLAEPALALPEVDAVQALIAAQIADATRRFYQKAEQRARELPDPPDGYRWVFIVEDPSGSIVDRTLSMGGRFELIPSGAGTDPAESDWGEEVRS